MKEIYRYVWSLETIHGDLWMLLFTMEFNFFALSQPMRISLNCCIRILFVKNSIGKWSLVHNDDGARELYCQNL